jgi:hypothetical protein
MNATDAKRINNTMKQSRFAGLFSHGVVKPIRSMRNRPCPCRSGRKFKVCCGSAKAKRKATEVDRQLNAHVDTVGT